MRKTLNLFGGSTILFSERDLLSSLEGGQTLWVMLQRHVAAKTCVVHSKVTCSRDV